MSLAGEFPDWDDAGDGIVYYPAPLNDGKPAGPMPALDLENFWTHGENEILVDEVHSSAPEIGVPANIMPELDLSDMVPNSALITEITTVQIRSIDEILKDEN